MKIGSMIAVMVEEGEDWQNAEIPESSESSSEASTSSEPSSAPSAGEPTARFHIHFRHASWILSCTFIFLY